MGEPVGLALLASHALADFPLQTDRMAARKLDNRRVRAKHAGVHVAVTGAFLSVFAPFPVAALAGLAAGCLHFGVDSRRWAEPAGGSEAYPIAVDQSLHIASLFLVALAAPF